MFRCSVCQEQATYDFETHEFKCKSPECGKIEKITPIKRRCIRCGTEYLEYTWFHPSGCTKCGRSFVD